MNYFDFFFWACAAYRVKYPAYYHSQVFSISSLPKAIDLLIKVIIVARLSIGQDASLISTISLVYASVLPIYPWFLLLYLASSGLFKVFFAITSLYGLEQAPWKGSVWYGIQKYLIFGLTFANLFST